MKIGIVLASLPSISETFLDSKINGLQKMGHNVVLFSNKRGFYNQCPVIKNNLVENYDIFLILRMMVTYIKLFIINPLTTFRFLKLEKRSGVDLRRRWENLFLNSKILKEKLDWLHFPFATLSLRRESVALAIGAKLGVSIRGYDICIYPLKYPDCYEQLWSKVDKVHSISDELLLIAKNNGLSDNVRSMVIKPAIDLDIFFYNSKSRNTKLFENEIIFLTIARLHWKKGLEYTLYALSLLKRSGVAFRYLLVGEGKERERLSYAIKDLGLSDNVSLFGYSAHKDIIQFYSKADIFIQYSIQEGFSNAVLEAQAMGLLTIVSNAEGLSENIVNEKTGWIVEKRNPLALYNKIKEILNMNDSQLELIKNYASKRVNEKFNLNQQKFDFNKFFD